MHEAVDKATGRCPLSFILQLESSKFLRPGPSKSLPRKGKRKVRVPPDAFAAPPAFAARGDHHPGICQSADGVTLNLAPLVF